MVSLRGVGNICLMTVLSGLSTAVECDHPPQTEVRSVKPYQLSPGVNHIWLGQVLSNGDPQWSV